MIASLCHQFICQCLHLMKGLQKCIIINIHLIDLKTFIDLHQMGRGKQTAGISGLSEDGSKKSTGTSLSIGSCHMDHLKFVLWTAKSPQAFLRML